MSNDLTLFEHNQRQRTLTIILATTMIAALALGIFDLQFKTPISVIALFTLAAFCAPLLWLNLKGNYFIAAALLSVVVLFVISFNLYDGDGVHDPGIMAFPIFILIGTLIFGKKASPYFALAAIGSLSFIVFLEVSKSIHPEIGPTTFGILVPMVTLMLAASAIIWVIVDNIQRNLERARASEAELRKNYDLTLEAWARVMEYRDRETEGHSRRLVALSTQLARALRVSEEEIVQLQRGALLHDIGKIAIPDEILLKPSTLTDEELHIVQKHPVYAREMLAGIPFLQPSISIAYSHHERWDGKGYPEGLQGREIPLLAHLFAVVDNWDALRSERPYRPAWSDQDARDYLKNNSGILFDPEIVDVFLGMIQK